MENQNDDGNNEDNKKLGEIVKNLALENEELKGRIEACENANDSLKNECNDLQFELNDKNIANENLREENEKLKNKILK